MTPHALPYLGLGLSSNLNALDEPHPYALLRTAPGLFDFVEYSAPLDVEEARREASLFGELFERRHQVRALFHPVHLNLYGPTLEPVEALEGLSRHCEEVGSPWVGNDVGWWHGAGGVAFPGYVYVAPPMTEAGLASCVRHALHVQRHVTVPLLLENPAVLRRTGPIHVLEFMRRLHAATGAPLILDVGHLLSFQLAHGLALDAGLEGFPFEAVAELHVAGGVVTQRGGRSFFVDDHTQPVAEQTLTLLDQLLPKCRSLRALTFEGDGHPGAVAVQMLRTLRSRMSAPQANDARALPRSAAARPETGVARVEAPGGDDPWVQFDEVHGVRDAAEDREGTRMEQDFRFAVMAESLDRTWPLTRLGLLAGREALAVFSGSTPFRTLFELGGSSLEAAFGRYARASVMRGKDPGLALLVALDMWGQAQLSRPAHSHVLAPGVTVGRFPQDVTELLYAAAALRRHLGQRSWGSGALESSGFAALLDVARRAGPGPVWLAARRQSKRLELKVLSEALGGFLSQGLAGAREPGMMADDCQDGLESGPPPSVDQDPSWQALRSQGWLRTSLPGVKSHGQ